MGKISYIVILLFFFNSCIQSNTNEEKEEEAANYLDDEDHNFYLFHFTNDSLKISLQVYFSSVDNINAELYVKSDETLILEPSFVAENVNPDVNMDFMDPEEIGQATYLYEYSDSIKTIELAKVIGGNNAIGLVIRFKDSINAPIEAILWRK